MQNALKKEVRVVIVEDEVHNSRLLQGVMSELRPHWILEATLESVEESVAWLEANAAPDVILMDIQLSDGICFSIFDKVQLPTSCRIIFTTAYNEYAIRAFKVNSVDYLLKPVENDALETAFLKYEALVTNDSIESSDVDYSQLLNSILQGKKEYRTRFLISGINAYHKVDTESIAYFYAENKLAYAVTWEKVEYTLDYNLEQIEAELNPSVFFRANRKVIVNIDSVKKIHNESGGKLQIDLEPSTNFDIVVSRLRAADFKIWMGK